MKRKAVELVRDNVVELMYEKLVDHYRRVWIAPRAEVEREIRKLAAKGLTREEAIAVLYREIFGDRAPIPSTLEEALDWLKQGLYPTQGPRPARVAAVSAVLLLPALLLLIFLPSLQSAVVLLLSAALVLVEYLTEETRVVWTFEEDLVLEGASGYLSDIAQQIPRAFQALALRDFRWQLEGNALRIDMKLRATVQSRPSGSGTASVGVGGVTVKVPVPVKRGEEAIDLGPFSINAAFERGGDSLVVRTVYKGRPPLSRRDLAALVYERLIVAFRSSIWEAWERVRPRAAVSLDFTRLVELLASTGFLVTAIRCPHCGGSIDLPEKSDTIKCPYCGSTIKALDLLDAVLKLLKDLS